MRLIRSWPAQVPAGRAYVVDTIERLAQTDFDYRELAQYADDVLLLEWDIAVGREELIGFAGRAAAAPDRVLVAPYRLYSASPTYAPHITSDVWAAAHWDGSEAYGQPLGAVPVDAGDPACDLFGFGMIYLPAELVDRFLATDPDEFNDTSFSMWHSRNVGTAALWWDARPVHLHFDQPDLT